MRARVENDPNLVRETASGAVLNTDRTAYEAIKLNKLKRKQADDAIRSELESLRSLVNQLLGQNNHGSN